MAQPVTIAAPAADAWNGLIAAERGGEKLAREKQKQVKEFVTKAVDEVGKQVSQGASMHQLAELYGVWERHQTQALPPFKGRSGSAVLVCSAPDLTLTMETQNGQLQVKTDEGRLVKQPSLTGYDWSTRE